ncbi:MAG: ead/Ea22-like family protein [Telluria sp.]
MRDYSELRKKAQAATPGTWSWWTSNSYLRLSSERGGDGDILHGARLSDGCCTVNVTEQNRAYIAAANPATILALLDELDALRSQVKPPKPKLNDYPADFESAWDAYPPRSGANKRTAFKAWSARIKAGAVIADMLSGVERYAAYVLAERTEERFIKQPATFFGPDEHYMLPWASKSAPAGRQSVNDEAKRRLFGGFDEFGSTDAPR